MRWHTCEITASKVLSRDRHGIRRGFHPPRRKGRLINSTGMRWSSSASTALVISSSLRAAASGSLSGLLATNFICLVRGCDVRDVDQIFFELVAAECFAARALHPDATGLAQRPFVRRQSLAGVPERVLPRGAVALVAPGLEI